MSRSISAFAAGAGLMYLLDPQRGRRRRALVRDKLRSAANEVGDAANVTARDLGNRARGQAARVRSLVTRREPSDFPRFMSHVREVRDVGDGRTNWVVSGPAGVPVEWDTEITAFVPNRKIAWRTVPGSLVRHAGSVRFDATPEGRTRVEIRMSYNPPAGALGHAVAALFGSDPKSAMDADLVRFKSLMEEGKTTARGETTRRDGSVG